MVTCERVPLYGSTQQPLKRAGNSSDLRVSKGTPVLISTNFAWKGRSSRHRTASHSRRPHRPDIGSSLQAACASSSFGAMMIDMTPIDQAKHCSSVRPLRGCCSTSQSQQNCNVHCNASKISCAVVPPTSASGESPRRPGCPQVMASRVTRISRLRLKLSQGGEMISRWTDKVARWGGRLR
jgi:hypothetical protein